MNEGATGQMELTGEQRRIVRNLIGIFPGAGLGKLTVDELVELLNHIRAREIETHAKSWKQGWGDGWADAVNFLMPDSIINTTPH